MTLILVALVLTLTLASLSPISRFKLGLASPNRAGETAAMRHHRVAHIAAFGSLCFLLAIFGRKLSHRLAALAGVVVLGALIEESQHLIYSNPLETWDIRDDAYGALAGFLFAAFFSALQTKRDASL